MKIFIPTQEQEKEVIRRIRAGEGVSFIRRDMGIPATYVSNMLLKMDLETVTAKDKQEIQLSINARIEIINGRRCQVIPSRLNFETKYYDYEEDNDRLP